MKITKEQAKKLFNLKKSPVDKRDYKFILGKEKELPKKVFYQASGIKNQGVWGSCVGHEFAELNEIEQKAVNGNLVKMSPLFLMYNVRKFDGLDNDLNEGTYLRAMCKAITRYGVCEESYMPYSLATTSECPVPSEEAYQNATLYRPEVYASVPLKLKNIKQAVYQCHGVGIGIVIYDNYFDTVDGVIQEPTNENEIWGGHGIEIVGYDDEKERFILQEHHGYDTCTIPNGIDENIPDGEEGYTGYKYLPYEALNWKAGGYNFIDEAWTITDTTAHVQKGEE